jgi:hypothetical protein
MEGAAPGSKLIRTAWLPDLDLEPKIEITR